MVSQQNRVTPLLPVKSVLNETAHPAPPSEGRFQEVKTNTKSPSPHSSFTWPRALGSEKVGSQELGLVVEERLSHCARRP